MSFELETIANHLWTTTASTLRAAALAEYSGLTQAEVTSGMRVLLREGSVDIDVTSSGELCWLVPGVARLSVKPDAPSWAQGLGIRFERDPLAKSVLLSAGMGLLFGPFGWLYAGAWVEAVLGIALYVGVGLALPRFMLGTFFGVLHPTCAVVAMLAAWHFNRTESRQLLFLPKLFTHPN